MTRIVAGWFPTSEDADRAKHALAAAGFSSNEYDSFYLAPPGQHGGQPLQDEIHHDEGAKETGEGAVKGAAIGGAVGLAAGVAAAVVSGPLGPAAAVAGAGIGAYVGSLAGAVNKAQDGDLDDATLEEPVERPAGAMVAVRIDREGGEQRAVDALRSVGAAGIETAEGSWRDGHWEDFDPTAPPHLIRGSELPRTGDTL
jgi:hypothetical protein